MLIELSSLKRSNISEARIVGILNKNANLEPDLSERPIKSAPVIAIPEREAPGNSCLLYTSPSPRDYAASRMPSSA